MNLQQLFNKLVIDNEPVMLPFRDRKEYDSLRVMLVRKYQGFAEQCSAVGMAQYDSQFIECVWDKDVCEGTFVFKDKADAKRKRKEYVLKGI